jgi:transmembrane sensor
VKRLCAAALAAVAAVAGLAVWSGLDEAHTYRTGVGEQRLLRLADNSIVELNALSTIRVRLSEKLREVDLDEGQALFHVARDAARPFIVRSGATTVRAVGTQFDVYRRRVGTVVTVIEGRVAVMSGMQGSSADFPAEASANADRTPDVRKHARAATPAPIRRAELLLVAGEQVTVPTERSARQEIKLIHTDVTVATAWAQNQLIFNDTPLSEVAEQFNRYSPRRLVITDPGLRSMGISGVYSSTQTESLIGFLRAQPNLQLSETDKEIRVTRRQMR